MFEFMRIEQAADGSIAFFAQPLGRPETRFAAREHGGDGAVFENPAHDFPQRVTYRRDGDARIAARIEGPASDGDVQGIDFPLRRVSCPTSTLPVPPEARPMARPMAMASSGVRSAFATPRTPSVPKRLRAGGACSLSASRTGDACGRP